MKTVAGRHRHAACHNKHYSDELFNGVNIDDLEWPWTPKIVGFVFFLQFLAAAHISRVNCTEITTDRPGQHAYEFIARCTLIAQVEGPMLSRVTWALLKLLVVSAYNVLRVGDFLYGLLYNILLKKSAQIEANVNSFELNEAVCTQNFADRLTY